MNSALTGSNYAFRGHSVSPRSARMAISLSGRKPQTDSRFLTAKAVRNDKQKGFSSTSKLASFLNSFQTRPYAQPVEAVPYHETLLVCSANQFLVSRLRGACCAQAVQQVIAHPQRIRHDGQRRIHGSARREEASVHDIKIVEVVGFAIRIQRRGLRVISKANRAVLMGNSGERDHLSDVKIASKQSLVAFVAMNRAVGLLHGLLELCLKPFMCFKVVRGVSQNDLPVAPNGDALVRLRQVFRCEPKVERVLSHQLKGEIRSDRRRARFQCDCVQLPDERDVPHR